MAANKWAVVSPLPRAADVALERELLGAPHHRLDHRAHGEVVEKEDVLGGGDLEEAIFVVSADGQQEFESGGKKLSRLVAPAPGA